MSMFEPRVSTSEALARIRDELKSKTADHTRVTELKPCDIARAVAVFQPRTLKGNMLDDEAHIGGLRQAIGNGETPRMLDPLTVWWSGRCWYVIDGHHRLEAYRRAGVESAVPVEAFEGTLDEAVAAAVRANSHDRLPMTSGDKANMAWRMVLFHDLSKSQIVKACAIADGTVANMRRARKDLEARGETIDDLAGPWEEARRLWKGERKEMHFDHDAARQAKAEKMAQAIVKALGGKQIWNDLEAFALALSLIDKRLPTQLMDSLTWSDHLEALAEARRDIGEPLGQGAQDEDY